jgi:hypothetical protein
LVAVVFWLPFTQSITLGYDYRQQPHSLTLSLSLSLSEFGRHRDTFLLMNKGKTKKEKKNPTFSCLHVKIGDHLL